MENEYFRLTHFYQAAFLITKGIRLIDIERPAHSSRATFVFQDSPECQKLTEAFNYGIENTPDVLVDVRSHASAIKQLKERLYQDNPRSWR